MIGYNIIDYDEQNVHAYSFNLMENEINFFRSHSELLMLPCSLPNDMMDNMKNDIYNKADSTQKRVILTNETRLRIITCICIHIHVAT